MKSGGFMKKTYFGFEASKRYIIITFGSFLLLFGSIYALIAYEQWYFTALFILSVIINLLWFIGSYSIIKTRIELGENTLRAAYHIWYEGFKATIDSKLIFDEISYKKMKSVEVVEVPIEINHTSTKALKIEVNDSYTLLLLLDRLNQEKSDELIRCVKKNAGDAQD